MASLHHLFFLSTLSVTILLHFTISSAVQLSPPTIPSSLTLPPPKTDTSSYIIHTDNSSRPSNFISQSEWYTSLIQTHPSQNPHTAGSKPRILYTYQMTLHGFSAVLTHEQAKKISNSPGVIGVYKDKLVQLHTTHTPDFLGLSPDFGLWQDSNFGDDVIIGLMDTGIWPESLSFNDSGLKPVTASWRGQCENGTRFNSTMCNNKLIGARFFKAGMEAMTPLSNTNDYASPRDWWGHGTHTASTAAGSAVPDASFYGYARGTARGIAPNAKIAMYKVCWGGCSLSDVLAGIEKSIEDGVHILSISLGSYPNFPYDHDPIAIGTLSAWRHGIFVACAAGNFGPHLSSVSNSVPWVTTVAAGSVDRSFLASVMLGSGEVLFGESLYFEEVNTTDMLPIVRLSYCSRSQLVPSIIMGKIVICQDADVRMGFYIQAAGGAGLISINGDSSSGETIFAQSFTLPALSVGYYEGKKVISYFESTKNPIARLEFDDHTIIRKTRAPRVASFSSRGPNPLMPKLLKPDILAPGTNILAAWPFETPLNGDPIDPRRSSFNIMSGTSMACPHVAGTAALIKHLHPDWSPSMIQSAMMTTAFTLDNRYRPIIDNDGSQDVTPLAIGSGHVFPQAASDPGLVYESGFEDYLNWLCAMNYTSNQIKKFVPWRPVDCLGVINDDTWDLNYPSFAILFNNQTGDRVVRWRILTKVSKFPESYAVRVVNMSPEKVDLMVYPDRLDFEEINVQRSYKVEFQSKISVNTSNTEYAYAYIIWESEEHQVKSPLVFMWNYV